MNSLQADLLSYLPFKRKQTSGGWLSFNAPCCEHNGESRDTRQRGGLIMQSDGGFSYHCFNCGFKTSWRPGRQLQPKNKKFLEWLGVPKTKIDEWTLDAIKQLDTDIATVKAREIGFLDLPLPLDSIPLEEAIEQYQEAIGAVEYIYSRGLDIDSCKWYYSPMPGYKDRLIVPFYFKGKIVGYTARKFVDGSPKYLSDAQSGYVYNIDNQHYSRKFVLVTEGPFDAIGIDGVAITTNIPNEVQIRLINSLGKQVIVCPDRDKPGMALLRTAIKEGWMCSIPPWEDDVKDVADAVKRYGKLFTIKTLVDYATDNRVKLKLFAKKYEKE
jgi:hypothetical protein